MLLARDDPASELALTSIFMQQQGYLDLSGVSHNPTYIPVQLYGLKGDWEGLTITCKLTKPLLYLW